MMIELEHHIEIGRSASDVFALLTDPAQMPAWQESVIDSMVVTPGPLRAGSEFAETWRGPGKRRRVSAHIAAYRDGELIAFAGDAGFMDFYCAFEVTASPTGATVTTRSEFRLHGLWRLARPLFAAEMNRETANELAALKRLAEASMPRPLATQS